MWTTSIGTRVLHGAEWQLFRTGLREVWPLIDDAPDNDEFTAYGIPAFDALQRSSKLALLAEVGCALRQQSVPAPALTAHREAAIAAIFAHLRQSLQVEIEQQDEPALRRYAFFWRRRILAACRQTQVAGQEHLPTLACEELDSWEWLLDALADRILWDRDFIMADLLLDADPQLSRDQQETLGIGQDYYTALPPDPTEPDLQAARQSLQKLLFRRSA